MSTNSSSWRGKSLPPSHIRTRMDSSMSESRGRSLTDISTVSSVLAPKHPEPFLSIPAQVLVQDNCRVHCGMVRKENKFNKWQDRYLVLHKGCLYYYKDSTDKNAQGQFSLSGYRLSTAPEKAKYEWTFKLTHIQPEKRKYFFSAHSQKELSEWLDKITEDMEEYCETIGTKPGYSPEPLQDSYHSSSSCSSIGSGEDTDKEYDYPLVDPPNFNQLKEQITRNSKMARHFAGCSISESEPTYEPPPPEFRQDLNSAISAISRTVTSTVQQTEHRNVTFAGGKASVDVSTILKRESTIRENEPLPPTPPKPAPRIRTLPSRTPVRCVSEVLPDERPAVPPRPTPPKPLPRPPTFGASSAPSGSSLLDEFECGSDQEEYLSIIPNDDPIASTTKRSTLERMRPDGNSFKERHTETAPCLADLLPDSAYKINYTKTDAIPLLLGREGVYMIHSSSRAETKMALSVCVGEKVKHFILFRNKEGFALDPNGPRFKNKRNLLDYYHDNPLPNQDIGKLKQPYT